MAKPSWRKELGTREFGINFYEFLGDAALAGEFLDFVEHVRELEDSVETQLDDSQAKLRQALSAIPRSRGITADGDTPEVSLYEVALDDHLMLVGRWRLLRRGLLLGAFAEFERIVGDVAPARSAKESLKAIRSELDQRYRDADELIQRIDTLQQLRNELSHGGGSERAQTRKRLAPLLRSRELRIDEDGVIELDSEFLPTALLEFHRATLAVLRAAGSLGWQMEELSDD